MRKFICITIFCFFLQINNIQGQESNVVNHHIVKESETAYRISSNNHIPLDSLMAWNNIDSNGTIEIGQILIISQPKQDVVILQETAITYTPLLSEPTKDKSKLSAKAKIYDLFKQTNHVLKVFIFVNLFFVFTSIVLFFFILFTRINKSIKKKKISKCQERYRDFITAWVYEEESNTSFSSLLLEINNKINREVFTTELLSLHSNLTGESAEKLVDLFNKVGLKKYAIKKTYSLFWNRKVQGIRRFVQMNIFDNNTLVSRYLNVKNHELRMEARIAWIELNPGDPFSFLDNSTIPLTPWWQLNSLISIKKLGEAPDFGRWVESTNDSVAIYAIKMIGILKQFESIHLVIKQLDNPNTKVRFESISTLGKLGSPAPIANLQLLFAKEDIENKAQIIKSLTIISDTDNIAFFRDSLLNEKDLSVRILTAQGLVALDNIGEEVISSLAQDANDVLKKIIMHAKDTRI